MSVWLRNHQAIMIVAKKRMTTIEVISNVKTFQKQFRSLYEYIPNKAELIEKNISKFKNLFKEANEIGIQDMWWAISEIIKSSRNNQDDIQLSGFQIKDYSWNNVGNWVKILLNI